MPLRIPDAPDVPLTPQSPMQLTDVATLRVHKDRLARTIRLSRRCPTALSPFIGPTPRAVARPGLIVYH